MLGIWEGKGGSLRSGLDPGARPFVTHVMEKAWDEREPVVGVAVISAYLHTEYGGRMNMAMGMRGRCDGYMPSLYPKAHVCPEDASSPSHTRTNRWWCICRRHKLSAIPTAAEEMQGSQRLRQADKLAADESISHIRLVVGTNLPRCWNWHSAHSLAHEGQRDAKRAALHARLGRATTIPTLSAAASGATSCTNKPNCPRGKASKKTGPTARLRMASGHFSQLIRSLAVLIIGWGRVGLNIVMSGSFYL